MGTDAFGRSTDEPRATAASVRPAAPRGGDAGDGVVVPAWLIGLLLCVIGLGGTALVLVGAERENRDDPLQQALRGEIVNLGERSLLRADRLAAAYAAARGRFRADDVVTAVAVAPTGLSLTVRDEGAFQRTVGVDVALGTSSTDAGRSESEGLAPARVALRGVQPAVRRVLARIRETTARIRDVSLTLATADGVTRAAEWRITVDDVRPRDATWYAAVDGRVVRRGDEDPALTRPPSPRPAPAATPARPTRPSGVTTTSSSSSVTIVRDGRRVRLGPVRSRRLQRCLGRAVGDRDALRSCLREAGL